MSQPGDTLDLLPANATPFERAQSRTSARMLDTDADVIRRARDPFEAPSNRVPYLCAERSVHRYVAGDEAGNRARAASSFDDHCGYGSPDALEREISGDTGQTVRVVEYWQQADLTWPDFVVEAVIDNGSPPPDVEALRASALRRKNVRDYVASARVHVRQPVSTLLVTAAATVSIRIGAVLSYPPPVVVGAGARAMPQIGARK